MTNCDSHPTHPMGPQKHKVQWISMATQVTVLPQGKLRLPVTATAQLHTLCFTAAGVDGGDTQARLVVTSAGAATWCRRPTILCLRCDWPPMSMWTWKWCSGVHKLYVRDFPV